MDRTILCRQAVAAGKVMPLVRRRWITGEGNDEDGEEGLHAFSDVEKVVRALHDLPWRDGEDSPPVPAE